MRFYITGYPAERRTMVTGTGTIKIELGHEFSAEAWEEIEDIIANALAMEGFFGGLTNSVTGNSTKIRVTALMEESDED
jgi:hypothetical protein